MLCIVMLSGLYGDLPQAKNSSGDADAGPTTTSAWTAPAFAPVVRRQASVPSPMVPRRARPAARPAGAAPADCVLALTRQLALQSPSGVARAGDIVVVHGADTSAAPASIGSLSSGVKDEYDPARPNDYEEICREREQQQRNAVAEAERQERLKAEAAAREASLPVSEALCSAAAFMRPFRLASLRNASGWGPQHKHSLLFLPSHIGLLCFAPALTGTL